jgi:hypothetical protein
MKSTSRFCAVARMSRRLVVAAMVAVIAPAAVSAAAAGGLAATWRTIAQRADFPVYRPLQTLGLSFGGVQLARYTGCLTAGWGNRQSRTGPHFTIDEPGDSSRCGQPGIANQVATTTINGVKVEVLVQCAASPKCTLKDGETNGEFLLFVPEHVGKHYAIQLDSRHIALAHFLEIAKSFTRVATSGQSSQKTWINASGCAAPGSGLVWAQHPVSIGITCDPHDQIVDARWQNWGQDTAQATATLAVDNCKPDCGDGRVRRYAITMLASKISHCGTRRVYASVIFYETVAGRRQAYPVPAEGFC